MQLRLVDFDCESATAGDASGALEFDVGKLASVARAFLAKVVVMSMKVCVKDLGRKTAHRLR